MNYCLNVEKCDMKKHLASQIKAVLFNMLTSYGLTYCIKITQTNNQFFYISNKPVIGLLIINGLTGMVYKKLHC